MAGAPRAAARRPGPADPGRAADRDRPLPARADDRDGRRHRAGHATRRHGSRAPSCPMGASPRSTRARGRACRPREIEARWAGARGVATRRRSRLGARWRVAPRGPGPRPAGARAVLGELGTVEPPGSARPVAGRRLCEPPRREPWTMVVAHDGVFKIALLALFGLSLERFWMWSMDLVASPSSSSGPGERVLRAHNLTAHLRSLERNAARRSTRNGADPAPCERSRPRSAEGSVAERARRPGGSRAGRGRPVERPSAGGVASLDAGRRGAAVETRRRRCAAAQAGQPLVTHSLSRVGRLDLGGATVCSSGRGRGRIGRARPRTRRPSRRPRPEPEPRCASWSPCQRPSGLVGPRGPRRQARKASDRPRPGAGRDDDQSGPMVVPVGRPPVAPGTHGPRVRPGAMRLALTDTAEAGCAQPARPDGSGASCATWHSSDRSRPSHSPGSRPRPRHGPCGLMVSVPSVLLVAGQEALGDPRRDADRSAG